MLDFGAFVFKFSIFPVIFFLSLFLLQPQRRKRKKNKFSLVEQRNTSHVVVSRHKQQEEVDLTNGPKSDEETNLCSYTTSVNA